MRTLLILLILLFSAPAYAEVFTVIVYGDTHEDTGDRLTLYNNDIIDKIEERNTKYVLHLGDSGDTSADLPVNSTAMQLLAGNMEYLYVMGNHDYDDITTKDSTTYDAYFTVESSPWIEGNFNGMHNSYDIFNVSGQDYLVLTLDYCPEDADIAWARGVLDANPNTKVILSIHYYFITLGINDLRASNSDPYANHCTNNGSGEALYQNLITDYPNILMVLSGHGGDPRVAELRNGSINRTDIIGNDVFNQIRQNYQFDLRGNLYIRIYTVNTETDEIRVQAYSPYLDTYLTDEANNFYFNHTDTPNSLSGVTCGGVSLF